MQNTVASVITMLTSMAFVQKAHILYICTVENQQQIVICLHNLYAHRGINWFECAPSWCEKVDLKQF